MRHLILVLATMLIGLIGATTLKSCTIEGCTDPAANNYNADAEMDDGSCTYPIISFDAAGGSGDVSGEGGSATSTFDWTNSLVAADFHMEITAANGGSFQVIVVDADGNVVIDETIAVGIGDQIKNVCAGGIAGTWSIAVILTNFDGAGRYWITEGCII
jgi:hypothetical protein